MASQPPAPTGSSFDPTQYLQDIAGVIPGVPQILGMLNDLKDLPAVLHALIKEAELVHPIDIVKQLASYTQNLDALLGFGASDIWTFAAQNTVGTFYRDMLEMGLGLKVGDMDAEAQRGINTVDTMLGFCVVLQFAVAAMEHFGTALFAGRWGKVLKDTLAKLPEEMGLSWALGLSIDEAFKTAVGRSVEEGINKQKRGNRIAWQQLRPMLKQHILDDVQLTTLLENQGFPDEQIGWLRKLKDVMLPVGDLQQLYLRQIMSPADVRTYIEKLGFDKEDGDRLFTMYIDKAETQSGTAYRSTARALFENQLITEDMYRQILTLTNVPILEITDDIAAIQLLHSAGKINTTIGVIKQRYQHHAIDPAEARRELAVLNYSDQAITDTIVSWDEAPSPRAHRLTQQKVLSYYISGLLSPTDTRTRLSELALDPRDIDFLIAHPTAREGAVQHKLTSGLVTQAYVDGAIDQPTLLTKLSAVGLQGDALQYAYQVAIFRKAHHKGSGAGSLHLTEGQILRAFHLGIFDPGTAQTMLEQLGYDSGTAMILLEIENKGPLQPPQPPAFPSLGDALAYLQSNGFTLHAPPDPQLLAAESMASAAGYTFDQPLRTPRSGP